MIVVLGATGNTGSGIAKDLISKGLKVRAVGRNAEKLAELNATEIKVGDLENAAFVKEALQGADAVYAMIPPKMNAEDMLTYQKSVGRNITDAIKANGVKQIVALSSVGANMTEDTGAIKGVHHFELMLNELPEEFNAVILRPAYFLENLYWAIGTVKPMGIMGTPANGDTKLAMVATKDISKKASELLADGSFKGKTVQYLLGTADISYNEIAKAFGEAIGKPDLQYVQFPYADAEAAMLGMGMSASVAKAMVQISRAANELGLNNHHTRTAENTTETSFADFLPNLVYAYQNS